MYWLGGMRRVTAPLLLLVTMRRTARWFMLFCRSTAAGAANQEC
jgi:hypothetical protein